MKKLFFLFSSIVMLLFVSCDNFMNGSDVQEQLEQLIDVANAKSNTLIVSQDTATGTFLSSGDKECKVGYSIDVQFSVKKDSYIFKGLEAVNKNSPAEKLNSLVKFEETSTDREKTDGIYKYKVTLLEESDKILIQPVCILIPKVSSVRPELIPTGYDQDQLIEITFNKAIDSTTNQFENFNNISIFSDSGDLKDFFDEPYLSDNHKVLNLRPKQNRHILAPDSNQKMNVTVSVDLKNIKDSDGLFLQENLTHSYRINDSFGNQKKSTLTVKEQIIDDISTGYFDKDGDFVCTVNYNIDLQFNVKKSSYVFQGLKVTHKDGTPFENAPVEFETISKNESTGSYKIRVLVKEESNDILIKPDCVPVPKISSMTPEYDSLGCEQDTTISIKFNKPVAAVTTTDDLALALSITDSTGQNLSQYFENPYFNDDSTILYIPTVKRKWILDKKDDTKDIIVKFDLSFIKDQSGNIGSGSYQNKYRINGSKDSKVPTLSSAVLYSSNNKQDKYYKQLSAKKFNDWTDPATDKADYIANHISNSVYAELSGSDDGSGIARAHVYERLLKYSDGSTPDTIQTLESTVEFDDSTENKDKYCFTYEMKNAMDGIIELEFYVEDYAGNKCKASDAKKFYVLKDTLVESNRIHFSQEVEQLDLTTDSWLPAISVVTEDSQNVKLTLDTNIKDEFYANCSSDFIIEAYWSYNKDIITTPITIDKAKGEYTFTRDVTKIVYLKLVVSDEIGNTKEIIKTMDPRPELNNFVWELKEENSFLPPPLKIKGIDALKVLANRDVSDSQKTYTRYIVYIYNNEDATGEPEKKMYLPSGNNGITVIGQNPNLRYGDDNTSWIYVHNLNNNQVPLNKLIRVYAVTFCGDFISPMTTDYVEFELTRWDDPSSNTLAYSDYDTSNIIYRVDFADGKSPKSSQNEGTASVGYKNLKTEPGPYVKDTIKVTTTEIKNSGTARIVIDDYKTEAAITEGNVKYEFYIVSRIPTNTESSETQPAPDNECFTDQTYKSDEAEIYIPARYYYKIFIRATGAQGDYLPLDLRLNTEELPEEQIWEYKRGYGSEAGLNFYLNGETSQTKNRLEFSGDTTPPSIKIRPESDPFAYCTPGNVTVPFPEDESGLYKNKNGNYFITYYLIPASGNRLQQGLNYTASELKENYKRYEKTLEFEPQYNTDGNEILPESIAIPTGNEKSGIYNLSVVFEDTAHNTSVLTIPCINRILGPGKQKYELGYHNSQREVWNPDTQTYTTEPYGYYGLSFNLEEEELFNIYRGEQNNQFCITGTATNESNLDIEFNENDYNKWYKICGYKNSTSAIEMGFYDTEYFFLKPEYGFFTCNSKNALPGLNGIQIFYDKPVFVHTMFFKDYIPEDIDKNNYKDWESRGAETGIMFATPPVTQDNNNSWDSNAVTYIATSTTYAFKTNYKGIPSGCYYTTIIHYADGEVVMTDIKYKE